MNGATTYDVMPFINWNVYLMINIENDRSLNSFFQTKTSPYQAKPQRTNFAKLQTSKSF